MTSADGHGELTVVPREAVTFPLPMAVPAGFDPADPASWPRTPGRLELVGGRLWYMPPCAEEQQQTVADAVTVLGAWRAVHPDFVLGTNEAGMLLEGEVRAAVCALWRRAELPVGGSGFPRVPPVLAVTTAGSKSSGSSIPPSAPRTC